MVLPGRGSINCKSTGGLNLSLTNETGTEVNKIILNLDQWACLRATGKVTVRTVGGPLTIKLGA